MTLLIAVPLATMCVALFGALLFFVAFAATHPKPVATLHAWVLWFFVAVAVLSGSAAAVVKLATIFAGTP